MSELTAPNGERVVFVEYVPGTHLPHSVLTTETNRKGATWWDLEFCRRDNQVYYYQSGGGYFDGTEPIHKMIGGRRWVWWDDDFVRPTVTARKWWLPFLWPRARYRRYYYRRLWFGRLDLWRVNAMRLHGRPPNPFDGALEDMGVYCRTCDDWLPDDHDRPCEHLEWSGEAGEFVYEGTLEVSC